MGGERLAFLDGLRGVAAAWVVLFHFGAGGQIVGLLALLPRWLDTLLIDWGYFGVALFFVLSGFVIALAVGDAHVGARYFGRFALRRAIRLDFPYWAAIGITLVVLTVKARLRPVAPTPSASVGNLAAHFFYLQDILGLPSINEVFWTLCFEVQFYLLFCLLLGLAGMLGSATRPFRGRAIVFGAAALVSILWPMLPSLHIRGVSLTHWHGFLLGAFACWTLTGRMSTRWFALYVAGLVPVWMLARDHFTLACVLTALVILAAGRTNRLGTLLTGRVPQFLGRISYSLYLLHVPISGGVFALVSRALGNSLGERALALALVIIANLVCAWLLWRFVEQPSTRLSRRLRLDSANA